MEYGCLLRENLGVVVLIAGLTLAFLAAGAWLTRQYSEAPIEEGGEVVRFGGYDVDDGPRLLVIVRTERGQVLQLHANRSSLMHCRAGSRIRVVRRGAMLTVSPFGCMPSSPRT